MFGKEPKKQEEKTSSSEEKLEIETIPTAFYGGKNPNVYEPEGPHKAVQPKPKKNLSIPPQSMSAPIGSLSPTNELTAVSSQYMQPQKMEKQSASRQVSKEYGSKHSRGRTIALVFFLLVILIAAATWYVLRDVLNTAPVSPSQRVEQPVLVVTPSTSPATSTVVNPVDPDPVVEPIIEPPPRILLKFPKTTFSEALDSDTDRLTDEEELIFGTRFDIADSDEDGYLDGQEIENLYNPRGIAPRRLIESGLVREYIHSSNQYRLYYPTVLNITPVDPLAEQVLISFISGDYISVQVVPLSFPNQSFRNWFSEFADSEQFSSITEEENRFNIPYLRRTDGLVAYFPTDQAVFVLLYQPGLTEDLRYKNIFNMVVQSFRPNRSNVQDMPEQVTIPGISGTSTVSSSISISSSTVSSTEQ